MNWKVTTYYASGRKVISHVPSREAAKWMCDKLIEQPNVVGVYAKEAR